MLNELVYKGSSLQLEFRQQAILGLTREAGGLWFVYYLVVNCNETTQFPRQLRASVAYTSGPINSNPTVVGVGVGEGVVASSSQ